MEQYVIWDTTTDIAYCFDILVEALVFKSKSSTLELLFTADPNQYRPKEWEDG